MAVGVVDDQELDGVRVGQTVVREFRVEAPVIIDLGVGPGAALQHVGQLIGAGSGHVAPVLNVSELIDHLAGDDEPMLGDEHAAERGESGLLQLEFHRGVVGSRNRLPLDVADVEAPRTVRARLPAVHSEQEPLPTVGDIVRGELPAVHRRLVVPEHAVADLEHGGERIRPLPALGQLSDEGLVGQEQRGVADLAPVDRPVADAELLVDQADKASRGVAEIGVDPLWLEVHDRPDRAAILGRGDHLAGARVEHHLLFGGGRLLALGCGERNGSHQRERQCH